MSPMPDIISLKFFEKNKPFCKKFIRMTDRRVFPGAEVDTEAPELVKVFSPEAGIA